MSELFDNITRIVGSPVPRRQALKAIGGALLGAVFAGSTYRKTRAAADQTCCQGDDGTCLLPGMADCNYAVVMWNQNNCAVQGGQWVAGGSCCTESLACLPNENCCGFICCPPGGECFGGVCCPPERLYLGGCCPEGSVPINNGAACCPADRVLPNGTCCAAGNVVVNGACCLSTRVCVGAGGATICCPGGRCCGGTRCCPGGCTPNGLNCGANVVSGARM
jgi:hypothetical protein